MTENAILRQNITAIMAELARLRAIHTYTTGSTLITFSGGPGDKASPAFYIPGGHIKITAQLTSIGPYEYFSIELYKIGRYVSVWTGHTLYIGTYETYVYSLEPGDYYLEVYSSDLDWQVTAQVYG